MNCKSTMMALAMLLAGGLLANSAYAAAVIYEPFADTDSTLSGNTPGTGLSGTWTASSMNVSVTGLTYGTLPTTGGVATKPTGSGPGNASVSVGTSLSSAGLLNNGATLWFSFLYQRPALSGTNDQAAFAIGDAAISGALNNGMGAGNQGFGVAIDRSQRVQAAYWDNGARTIALPTTTVISAGATALIVGKIVWNANDALADTLEIYLPAAGLALPGTAHSSTSFVLTQSSFGTLTFGGKNTESPTIDEIRFGATYNDVIGVVIVPTPATLPAGLAILGLAAMRRRRVN